MLQVWLRLGHMLDICQIFIIHSQNKIKIVQVKSFKTARFGVQFNSVLISGALTFAVGRISLVISGGTRRVNFEIVSIATFIHYMLEKAFRCRTSANIAQANEAYLEMIVFSNRKIKSLVHWIKIFKKNGVVFIAGLLLADLPAYRFCNPGIRQ